MCAYAQIPVVACIINGSYYEACQHCKFIELTLHSYLQSHPPVTPPTHTYPSKGLNAIMLPRTIRAIF